MGDQGIAGLSARPRPDGGSLLWGFGVQRGAGGSELEIKEEGINSSKGGGMLPFPPPLLPSRLEPTGLSSQYHSSKVVVLSSNAIGNIVMVLSANAIWNRDTVL